MPGETIAVNTIRNILLVTVPPEPDDTTLSFLQDKVLGALEKYDATGVILDISVVNTVDSFFARTLGETCQMVQVMGRAAMVAGMQADVAITATQLGLTLEEITTTLDVDTALDLLEKQSKRSDRHGGSLIQ